MPDHLLPKIEDELLTTVMKHSPFPPLDTATSYHRLKSFDALLDCIGQASREGKPLHTVVEGYESNG